MGWSFRKSIKVGPARINLSKSGVGYSVGAGGVRYTKRAGSRKRAKASGSGFNLIGICLGIFLVMAVAAAVYTFVLRFKWVFLALGILAIAGTVAYFVIKHHKNQPPVDSE